MATPSLDSKPVPALLRRRASRARGRWRAGYSAWCFAVLVVRLPSRCCRARMMTSPARCFILLSTAKAAH